MLTWVACLLQLADVTSLVPSDGFPNKTVLNLDKRHQKTPSSKERFTTGLMMFYVLFDTTLPCIEFLVKYFRLLIYSR